jgi:hypothetical protein
MKNKNSILLVVVALAAGIVVLPSSQAGAAIYYSENFESYAPGTLLSGAPGWNPIWGEAGLQVGSNLHPGWDGIAVDGSTATAGAGCLWAYTKAVSGIPTSGTVIISAEGWGAWGAEGNSHASAFSIESVPSSMEWLAGWNVNTEGGEGPGWWFDVRTITGDSGAYWPAGQNTGVLNTSMTMSIILNKDLHKIYGTLTDGTTVWTSPVWTTLDSKEDFGALGLTIDRRPTGGTFRTGFDIDNINITPEPATIALLGLGSLALLRRKVQN